MVGKAPRRKPGIVIKSLSRRTNSIPAGSAERALNSPPADRSARAKQPRIVISSFSKKDNLLGRGQLSGDFNEEAEADARQIQSQGLLPQVEPTASGSLHSLYLQTEPSRLVRVFSKQLRQIQNCSDISFDDPPAFAEPRPGLPFASRQAGEKAGLVSKPESIQPSKTTSSAG